MNFATGEIPLEEIMTLYSTIQNHLQKDRNSVCLGLQVLSTNIRDWYKDNMNMTKRLLDRREISYGEFYQYTYKGERASVARESQTFLNEVLSPYERDKLSRKRRLFFWKRKNDYDTKSEKLKSELLKFENGAIAPKETWVKEHKDDKNIELERKNVELWIQNLRKRRETIEKLVSRLQSDLRCELIPERDLIERIRSHIRR